MLLVCIIFAIMLSIILMLVYYITSYVEYSDMSEKMTAFECGFDPLSNSRTPFSTRFLLLVMLFLIFDVEVALLFPMLSILTTTQFSSNFMGMALLTFLLILLLGTFHEWNEGALDWVSKLMGQLNLQAIGLMTRQWFYLYQNFVPINPQKILTLMW